jgi:hypothetical protein
MKNKLVLTVLAILAVLFALSYLGSTKIYTVTYTVKGLSNEDLKNAGMSDEQIASHHETATVTLQNASGGSDQFSVDLPWTTTMKKHAGDVLYLSAQGDKGTFWLDVEIRSDGNLVQEAHSGGDYGVATASGSVQ